MKLARNVLSLAVATALSAGSLSLLTVAPAAAAVAAPTTTTLTVEKKVGEFGDELGLYINSETHTTAPVNGSNEVWGGTAHLQMRPNGSTTWQTIASDASPGYQYFPEVKFRGNATYRVYYQGAFYDDYPEDVTYGDSVSPEVYVKTVRNLSLKDVSKGSTARGKFKAGPDFGGKKFVFHKKVGKQWKLFKRVKATSKGVAVVAFPVKGTKTWYRVTVPGNKKFTTTKYKFPAYRY